MTNDNTIIHLSILTRIEYLEEAALRESGHYFTAAYYDTVDFMIHQMKFSINVLKPGIIG
jgi:hypothetical protein